MPLSQQLRHRQNCSVQAASPNANQPPVAASGDCMCKLPFPLVHLQVREVLVYGEQQHSGVAGPAASAEQVARLAEGLDGVGARLSRVAAEVESLSGQCVRMADLNHLLGR